MRVLQAALIAALVAAPVASAAAGLVVRLGPAPIVFPHGQGEHHAFWRDGDGDHDFWRHRHRQEFFGPGGAVVGQAVESGPEPTPSPFVVSAPVFVNVTFTPAVGPQREWTDGPKLIEIGRDAPPRGRLPLVVYGD
jgi:hypothetical protein